MQIDEARKTKPKNKKKHKRKRPTSADAPSNLEPSSDAPSQSKRKKKLIKQPDDRFQLSKSEEVVEEEPEASQPLTGGSKKESNRQRKRKKYQKLLEEKKVQMDIISQQKALNYLSQWKHNREGWKFEKLRQVWLQQNLFSTATIPDKYWETAMEYFSNSKGQSRQSLIQDAMKIIESAEKEVEEKEGNKEVEEKEGNKEVEEKKEENEVEEDSEEELEAEVNTKLNRARELLQYLQE